MIRAHFRAIHASPIVRNSREALVSASHALPVMRYPQHLLTDPNLEQRAVAVRVLTIFAIVVALVGVLIVRMVQLQVVDHARYATLSEDNRIQLWPVPPPRGRIFDRNGVLLADNVPVSSLSIVRERVPHLDETLASLTSLVGLTDEEIAAFRKRLTRPRRPYEPVALRVTLSDQEIARVAVEQFRLPGVQIDAQLVRHYPQGALTAHAVGAVRRISEDDLDHLDPVEYAGTDFIGRLGVEKFYEDQLHGHVGHQRVEIDARGRLRRTLDQVPAEAGRDLTLYLDTKLQAAAEAALQGRRGAIVAIEPATGGILALVSNPGYDPNPFVTGISTKDYRALQDHPDNPLFNRVTRGLYAPGSTFKPYVGLAALHAGVTTWEHTVYDPGWYRLPGSSRLYRDWSWTEGGGGGHGIVNLEKAIYRSANVYFFHVAHDMGVDRFTQFVRQFGFGGVMTADVADASPGVLPDRAWKRKTQKQMWYPGDTINLGVGQGFLLVTPMQLTTAATVLANRGRLVPPRMLMQTSKGMADLDLPLHRQVNGVAPSDWEHMVQAMEDVVHRNAGRDEMGTAYKAIGTDIQYRMAGKSGTAQVVEIKQGHTYKESELNERQRKHAWFMAFAPADLPKIAVVVLVENGGGGSAVAAPVARAVVDAYLLPQQAPQIVSPTVLSAAQLQQMALR